MIPSVTKAAAAVPADTITSGWADPLVQTAIVDFTNSLLPRSVYGPLAERGDSYVIGRNGVASIPARNTTASLAGNEGPGGVLKKRDPCLNGPHGSVPDRNM
jgi:hypothetical protein